MSDFTRHPDWPSRINQLPAGTGIILRDYEHPQRAALAAQTARLCVRQKRPFLIAGDARLARRFGAGLHIPAWQVRPVWKMGSPWQMARCGGPCGGPLAAQAKNIMPGRFTMAGAHNAMQIIAAARRGCQGVLISPVFATQSHPDAQPLGVLRCRILAGLARHLGLAAFALGGMDDKGWHRLGGAHSELAGYGAIASLLA